MRPTPILFLHGFNGQPSDWDPLRAALIERGADPELLWPFHYGWRALPNGQRAYNNQGDIREIAAQLAYRPTDEPEALRSQVRRLRDASVERGGPARVTLVAHSMGGLVARYFLACRTPDERGTVYDGTVRQLITIGTPHLGHDLARVLALVPPDAPIWSILRGLERLPAIPATLTEELAAYDALVRRWQGEAQRALFPVQPRGLLDSPALRQMAPDSPFLRALQAPGSVPANVRVALLWGEVQVGAEVRLGPLLLWGRSLGLGDLTVPALSASSFPPAPALRFPIRWDKRLIVQVGRPAVAPALLDRFLPPVAHRHLLTHPEVHALIAQLTGSGEAGEEAGMTPSP